MSGLPCRPLQFVVSGILKTKIETLTDWSAAIERISRFSGDWREDVVDISCITRPGRLLAGPIQPLPLTPTDASPKPQTQPVKPEPRTRPKSALKFNALTTTNYYYFTTTTTTATTVAATATATTTTTTSTTPTPPTPTAAATATRMPLNASTETAAAVISLRHMLCYHHTRTVRDFPIKSTTPKHRTLNPKALYP